MTRELSEQGLVETNILMKISCALSPGDLASPLANAFQSEKMAQLGKLNKLLQRFARHGCSQPPGTPPLIPFGCEG